MARQRSHPYLCAFDTDAVRKLGRLPTATWGKIAARRDRLRGFVAWSPTTIHELLGTNLNRGHLTKTDLDRQQTAVRRYALLACKNILPQHGQMFLDAVYKTIDRRRPRDLPSPSGCTSAEHTLHIKRFLGLKYPEQVLVEKAGEGTSVVLRDESLERGVSMPLQVGFPAYAAQVQSDLTRAIPDEELARGRKLVEQGRLTFGYGIQWWFMLQCWSLEIPDEVGQLAYQRLVDSKFAIPEFVGGLLEAHFHVLRILGLAGKADENTGRDLRFVGALGAAKYVVTEDRSLRHRTNQVLDPRRALSFEEGVDVLLHC